MRLQQLDIKGFKSFANQTVVNFDADVIGIVGPNGSGKSNIVDAIRWVLGEQKGSELRLDKMASIIFNGTKKKKPGNLASVSLTFENDKELLPTEYQTVTITRMLYRSGDSEYRLNGVQCRLKDIRNLFLDTGIGSNSYAIIALGMVDDILADKDNSRRRMFEQAAGISKYKNRKKESLRKLKNTEDDLARIEDLLFEISNNLKSLEKQAKRARKYRDLKAQYRDLSLLHTGIRVEKLRIDYEKLREETDKAETAYRQTDAHITELENKLDEERKKHVEKEQRVGDRQRKLNALNGELRGLESELQLLQQRKSFVARQTTQLAQDLDKAKREIKEYDDQIKLMENQLEEARSTREAQQQLRSEAEGALQKVREGHAGLKSRLDERLKQQQDEERKIFDLEKRRAINGNKIENFRFQVERNLGEMEDRRGERERQERTLAELQEKIERQETEVTKLEEQETNRLAAIDEAVTDTDHLQAELNSINRGLDARRNEFKLTKSMIDSLEGFPESIRFLSKNRSWTSEPQLLSDLLLVQPEYRAAIENFLDPFLNYYVVQHAEEARAAIRLLNEQQKGKANFFVLDALPEAATRPLTPDSGIGRHAMEVITVEDKYRNLVRYLLHGVLVSDDKDLPEPTEDGTTVITADGRFVRRPYSVAGGSLGLFEGKKIGRKKNLEVLEKAIKKAEQEAEALNRQLAEGRAKLADLRQQRIDREIQRLRRELGQLQQQSAGVQARVEGFQSFFRDTTAKNEQFLADAERLERLNEEIDRDLAQLRRDIEDLRQQVSGTDASYQELSEALSAASARFNQENISFIQQQNRVEGLENELTFRRKRRDELRRQEVDNRQQHTSLEKEARQFDQQEETLNRNLDRMRGEKAEYQATLNSAEKAYYEARSQINAMEEELRRDNRQRQDAQVRVNQLKDRFTDVRFKLNGVEERLKIEFDLSLEQLAQVEIEEWTGTVPELEMKVDRLRSRIGNYGEINPMAVEAYEEMSERHGTITGQRDDIIEAKDTLIKTIKEIEETATVQFLDAFERVRVYFIDVFRSLFTEDDNCDLILLDPENPLESNIEIVAKPKGKRPQTINQLSGGEKTLTATALLFALYLLKPAPFCIFDEVDAPLDDANIAKFNRIVKKFSKDSQFIIVTHNKLTMEAVDSIYGVFTTEQGGSGVVPVQFTELEGSTTFSAR